MEQKLLTITYPKTVTISLVLKKHKRCNIIKSADEEVNNCA